LPLADRYDMALDYGKVMMDTNRARRGCAITAEASYREAVSLIDRWHG